MECSFLFVSVQQHMSIVTYDIMTLETSHSLTQEQARFAYPPNSVSISVYMQKIAHPFLISDTSNHMFLSPVLVQLYDDHGTGFTGWSYQSNLSGRVARARNELSALCLVASPSPLLSPLRYLSVR